MKKADIGIVGMAVMGQNLALNIESRGYTVAVYNRTAAKTEEFVREKAVNRNIVPSFALMDFIDSLDSPRRVMLMVKPGKPVDDLIDEILPGLDKGDVLIDGGNSHFVDTDRRCKKVSYKGIHYLGTGVSGGEYGALHGPSIMVGGDKEGYELVSEIFEKASAKVDGDNCCSFLGLGSSGHYVKMVHNGIEYAIMQILAESYEIMKEFLGMSPDDISEIFSVWDTGRLNSYLVEISAIVLRKRDEETGQNLVEVILDTAEQKGTGRWTAQSGMELGVFLLGINAAVESRILSGRKDERVELSDKLEAGVNKYGGEKKSFLSQLEAGCFASILLSYAQGFSLLSTASEEFGYGLDLADVARIWKGGCIVRAKVLDMVEDIYRAEPRTGNLLSADSFGKNVMGAVESLRSVVIECKKAGIPIPALSASLEYFDGYRKEVLPANFTQAQRDYFGAHTYKRIDKPGVFHTKW